MGLKGSKIEKKTGRFESCTPLGFGFIKHSSGKKKNIRSATQKLDRISPEKLQQSGVLLCRSETFVCRHQGGPIEAPPPLKPLLTSLCYGGVQEPPLYRGL